MTAPRAYQRTPTERLWSRVDRSGGPDACWLWTGPKLPAGYGRISSGPGEAYAHRLAWIVTHGEIPDGLWVLHKCDNPPCCNPTHLFLGTSADNVMDREQKGRGAIKRGHPLLWKTNSPRGTARKEAKLTEDSVRELISRYRAGGVTQKVLAAEYGVHQSIVSEILSGKRWPHVSGGI